jgi:ParB-like chromosome segregation protein Spo0J
MLELSKIRIDGGTQPREVIDESVIQEYADALLDGAKLPPVEVFYDGIYYWLADGFHRYFAHKRAEYKEIDANVTPGTKRDAIFFSVGANATHGIKRTKADKIQAIRTVLDDFEYAEATDEEIGKLCNMGRITVNRLRKELGIEKKSVQITRGSKTYTKKITKPKAKPINTKKEDVKVTLDDQKTVELANQIVEMEEEMEGLRAQVAVKHMDSTEEEKISALDTINMLRKQVKDLERDLSAVTTSRNDFQQKNAELLKQVSYWKKRAEKAEKQAA